jgi:GntR family transcriptional regulator
MRGGLPLYVQIESELRERIRAGKHAPGSRFPTDQNFCEEFNVSRATVRLALDSLQRDGMIHRFPGRGTFVNHLGDKPNSLQLKGSIERIITEGDSTGADQRIVTRDLTAPNALETQELKLTAGQKVVRFTGFRQLGDERIGCVTLTVPEETGERLDVQVGGRYVSISKILSEKLGLKPLKIRQVISTSLAGPEIADALNIACEAPVLIVRRTFYGLGDAPLEVSVTSYPGDRHQYEIAIT